ncbi:hypothetical protein SDC9_187925 [bioreactor metagenome]|uniref:Uncharacterized protein n=1 Tax=bioreactor metagenome TaxID=1076179 RepID=A0A645HQ82_9ZZZZ
MGDAYRCNGFQQCFIAGYGRFDSQIFQFLFGPYIPLNLYIIFTSLLTELAGHPSHQGYVYLILHIIGAEPVISCQIRGQSHIILIYSVCMIIFYIHGARYFLQQGLYKAGRLHQRIHILAGDSHNHRCSCRFSQLQQLYNHLAPGNLSIDLGLKVIGKF